MNKTALNLIAIGVFMMTLSFFITPIFHISPTIPALITFSLLSFFTVDTLGLENQGITLILDRFLSKKERERIIIHEAGHFLTAYLLEIPITNYSLTAWDAFQQRQKGQGGVIFDQKKLFSQPIKIGQIPIILEKFCTVLMAGIAAEKLHYDQVEGGEEDRQQLQKILQDCGIPSPIFPQKESWSKLQATNLIKQNQSAYLALVEAMKNKADIAKCYQVIQDNLSN
jgi:uncharacterized membrane protein YidH (DUF202 family)